MFRNESFSRHLCFSSVEQMEFFLKEAGYKIPKDGLKENRDYESVNSGWY